MYFGNAVSCAVAYPVFVGLHWDMYYLVTSMVVDIVQGAAFLSSLGSKTVLVHITVFVMRSVPRPGMLESCPKADKSGYPTKALDPPGLRRWRDGGSQGHRSMETKLKR